MTSCVPCIRGRDSIKGNIVVIGPILFAYSEFKDFRTDGWRVRHDNSKPTTRVIPNRSVVAWECSRYVFSIFVFDFCARIYGVAVGVSELIDDGRHRECCGKCDRVYIFSLVFEGGKRFRAIGWLAYNSAKHVFDWIAPDLEVVWCGQTRTKQMELTG